jgi:hypothetical protein
VQAPGDGPMGRRHKPLGRSYSVGDAINLMEVYRFRQVCPICQVRLSFASCTSQSARAPVTELEGKAGVTNVSHGLDLAATPRQPAPSEK